jgi:hypothetical protein
MTTFAEFALRVAVLSCTKVDAVWKAAGRV